MHRHHDKGNKYHLFLLGAAFGGLVVTIILIYHSQPWQSRTNRAPIRDVRDEIEQQVEYQIQVDDDDGKSRVRQDRDYQYHDDNDDGYNYKSHSKSHDYNRNVNHNPLISSELNELFPNRNIAIPTNGKSRIPQIQGNDDSTIFVAVAAYRDVECAETLLEMYEMAWSPHRFRIRILQHISSTNSESESCAKFYTLANCDKGGTHPICRYASNIFIKSYPRTQGRGPVDARHRVQALLDDEEFALMMDAHMKFKRHWDKLLMDNWNDLQDEMAIITTYPQGYVLRNETFRDYQKMTVLCDSQFMEELQIPRHKAGQHVVPGKSYLIPFWSACISFSKAHAFREVMFDCCAPYTFDGEEFSYGIRLWTAGYDFYSPNDSILVHQYYHPGVIERTGRKRNLYHENKWGQHYKIMRAANERLRRMLGLPKEREADLHDLEKYSLGNVRTRQQFIDFSGVRLDEGTQDPICNKILFGEGLKMVPLNYQPELKYTGTTIDPDPLLATIRQHRHL